MVELFLLPKYDVDLAEHNEHQVASLRNAISKRTFRARFCLSWVFVQCDSCLLRRMAQRKAAEARKMDGVAQVSAKKHFVWRPPVAWIRSSSLHWIGQQRVFVYDVWLATSVQSNRWSWGCYESTPACRCNNDAFQVAFVAVSVALRMVCMRFSVEWSAWMDPLRRQTFIFYSLSSSSQSRLQFICQ